MSIQIKKKHKTFEGETCFASHQSDSTKTEMNFSYFCPRGKVENAIIWLSGLTCTEENFITKAGAQRCLAAHNTMVICPDTSPRGLDIPGSDDSYDFGTGASFYLNATESPYAKNYQMEDYIIADLIGLLKMNFDVKNISLFGHSMGGHGALTLGLKYPELFKSVSAFSPIVNPTACPWGEKAFKGYLGEDKEAWKNHDACELLKAGKKHPKALLIHQGKADNFYQEKQLLTENILEAAKVSGQEIALNMEEGYDHSYYFISTFIGEHIRFHLEHLEP